MSLLVVVVEEGVVEEVGVVEVVVGGLMTLLLPPQPLPFPSLHSPYLPSSPHVAQQLRISGSMACHA